MNYHLTLEFLGTNYSGWLYQPNHPSVQGTLQKILEKLLKRKIVLTGCSRTDSGVHACNFHAHFAMKNMPVPLDNFARAMNSLLPQDIVIKNIEEVNEDFHPVTSAQEKTYCYTILNRPLPSVFDSETSTHVTFTLNDKAIYEAASYLEGEHNFRSFCTDPETKKHHVRCIKSITVRRDKDFLLIHVTGNGFLYNMVRIIVGTLIEVGRGRIGPEIIPDILASRDRDHAGPTAAPQGLCLVDVIY